MPPQPRTKRHRPMNVQRKRSAHIQSSRHTTRSMLRTLHLDPLNARIPPHIDRLPVPPATVSSPSPINVQVPSPQPIQVIAPKAAPLTKENIDAMLNAEFSPVTATDSMLSSTLSCT